MEHDRDGWERLVADYSFVQQQQQRHHTTTTRAITQVASQRVARGTFRTIGYIPTPRPPVTTCSTAAQATIRVKRVVIKGDVGSNE